MIEVMLMMGNISSGKSLLANKFMQDGFIPISRDSIIEMLYCGKYEFYNNHQPTLINSIQNNIIQDCVAFNRNIVIDETLMTRKIRKDRISSIRDKCSYYNNEAYITLYNFGQGTKELNLKNRRNHHKNTPIEIWETVFDKMYDSYQEPSLDEGIDKIININRRSFKYHDKYIDLMEYDQSDLHQFDDIKKLWNESIYNIITIYIENYNSRNDIHEFKQYLINNKIKYDFMRSHIEINNGGYYDKTL